MGSIKKVYYEEIDHNVCDVKKAGEYYYHYNLLLLNDDFRKEYESYETFQINLRNNVIGNAKENNKINGIVKLSSAMIAISPIKNKVVVVTELR